MPPRSMWKGYLKLSLVSVPVKAYTASNSSSGEIHLNQLHAECHSRIKYVKTCPLHGEISSDEIISGYEYAKGQYVIIDESEIEKLRPPGEKSVEISAFVSSAKFDPIYFSGKSYYLVPDGPVGQKPYSLIRQTLTEEKLYGVAQVVISSREQLVLVRPVGDLLVMTGMVYENEVKQPQAFADEIVDHPASEEELKLTKTLVSAFRKPKLELGEFKDLYTERLTALIQSKVEGRELVSPPAAEEPHVINIMDALRQSVARTQESETASTEPPKKKMAPSARAKKAAAPKKRKKSG